MAFTENDLSAFCAPGTNVNDEMISVAENVSLRLITFTPKTETTYPPIVFIPGWISMIAGWKEVLLEMTKDFKIHYLETREKISSQVNGTNDFSVEAIGRDISSLIKILKLRSNDFILLGSSLGATSIMDCVINLEVDPKCLVLIGPNAEFRVPRSNVPLIKLFYPPLYNFFKPYVKWYLRNFRLNLDHDREQYEKYSNVLDFADPWKLKKAALAVRNYSVWNLLDKIELACLVIGASKDKLHEPENLQRISSSLKNSTFVDMDTNKRTHSKEVVFVIREYLNESNSVCN